jgi:hypothetical protein
VNDGVIVGILPADSPAEYFGILMMGEAIGSADAGVSSIQQEGGNVNA